MSEVHIASIMDPKYGTRPVRDVQIKPTDTCAVFVHGEKQHTAPVQSKNWLFGCCYLQYYCSKKEKNPNIMALRLCSGMLKYVVEKLVYKNLNSKIQKPGAPVQSGMYP